MNELRVTLVQTNLYWEDVDANMTHLGKCLGGISNTDVVVLPEMFATGFSMNAGPLASDSYKKGLALMQETAAAKQFAVGGSLICEEGGLYYNRFLWVEPDGSVQYYNKRHLFTLGGESDHYTKGTKNLHIRYKGWTIMPLVCYDLRFPVWSRNASKDPYDLLIYAANWPEKRIGQWDKLLPARAIENQCYVVGLNRVGKDGNGHNYTGHSAALDYRGEGEVLESNKEVIHTVVFKKDELDAYRQQLPFLNDADAFEVMG
jgi:omega-amidase